MPPADEQKEEAVDAARTLDEVGATATPSVDRRERLAEIYRDEYAFVRRSLRHLGVLESEIRDAIQSVFLVVVRKIEAFEGRSTLRTWLFGICLRTAKTVRRKRPKVEPLEPATGLTRDATPDEAVAAKEAVALVARLLEALDDDQRTVFVLVELEDMRPTEVAASLGVKLNTVYSRLRLARNKFDRALSRHKKREERRPHGPAQR